MKKHTVPAEITAPAVIVAKDRLGDRLFARMDSDVDSIMRELNERTDDRR